MKKLMSDNERRAFVDEFAVTTVALAVAEAIKNAGISQREIADRLGVTEARISQILNATGNPTIKSLARLADALGHELRIDLAHESHVPNQNSDWQVANKTWADPAEEEELETNEQEQYVAVAA